MTAGLGDLGLEAAMALQLAAVNLPLFWRKIIEVKGQPLSETGRRTFPSRVIW